MAEKGGSFNSEREGGQLGAGSGLRMKTRILEGGAGRAERRGLGVEGGGGALGA